MNKLGEGKYFGEVTLLGDNAPSATVVANSDVDTVTLDSTAFSRLLGTETLKKSFSNSMQKCVPTPQ